ncbi:MAG: hypothetical protein QF492_01135 [Candidatus Krumholzibacteria bacterium]|jgi:hypothetical protein|nr:hypothetical protein [Candidatus Krumholzibacteria bacterium]MDP6797531.1 hypothetical protein [Candidatus Krumholzibacteria bacterium]MDP7021378.1 hypothetical protein [Candidatus Krumholzibacteria bacterium]
MAESIGIWFAAFLTLAIFSFLYKDNPFYKFAEHLFTGVSAAYWMVVAYWVQIHPNLFGNLWWPESFLRNNLETSYVWIDRVISGGVEYPGSALVDGTLTPELIEQAELVNVTNAFYYVPLVLGILFFTRLIPKVSYLSRWPLAFVMGMAAGLRLYVFLQSNAMAQIHSTIVPSTELTSFVSWANYLLLMVGVFTGLIYFYFSREHKGVFGGMSRIGVYFLMVSFGASFGYTVMARISLLLGRFQFLLGDWLHLVN